MQTKRLYWHLVYINCSRRRGGRLLPLKKGNLMSNTASVALAPTSTLFGRLLATLDRLLMAYAEMTIRNGDVPRYNV